MRKIISMQIVSLCFVLAAVCYKVNADEPKYTEKLEGHSSSVNSAVFSPNGKFIATASSDKTARIWDAATGKDVRKLEGHIDRVESVVFSSDGKFVVTASKDKTARIWDAATGREVQKLMGHTDCVYSAVFSSDGKFVATASNDNTALIWDTATGNKIRKLTGHTNAVRSIAFSPDGKFVATASRDRTARIWDAATGREVRKLEGHSNSVLSAIFSHDGSFLATASADKTARIWHVATGKEIQKLERHTGVVTSVVFSPDGEFLATASLDKTTRISHVITEKEVQKLPQMLEQIKITATGKEVQKLEHTGEVRSVAFSPDGKFMVVSCGNTAPQWKFDVLKYSSDRRVASESWERDRQRLERDLAIQLRAAGFNDEHLSLSSKLQLFVRFGTKDLLDRYKTADKFNRVEIEKEIEAKQREIMNKIFDLVLPYSTTNIKVNDSTSSVEMVVPLPVHAECFRLKTKKEHVIFVENVGERFFESDLLGTIDVYITDVGKYDTVQKTYDTRAAFLTKDDKIKHCHPFEVAGILRKGGVVYWEEVRHSTLHIIAEGKTELIKKLVQNKDDYEVKISLDNLVWLRKLQHGWYSHKAIEQYESTSTIRMLQRGYDASRQPVYFVTAVGEDVPERSVAIITDVQIIEKKK
jgi:WD40 repeat protein